MTKRRSSNFALNSARKAKNDEFFTQMPDVENELRHYSKQLKGKIIFCNCDDPAESNFFLYFVTRFKELKLKKLITTHYKLEGQSYKIEVKNGDTAERIKETIKHDFHSSINRKVLQSLGVITPLQKNGDFRSPECIECLRQSDAVITNPPFSLFREYVVQLMEYKKSFLIIGNDNAITYKEIFKMIKENAVWRGYGRVKEFRQIDGTTKKFGNVGWFTNLNTSKRHEELTLYKRYTPKDYPKYDNYEAIDVSKVAGIPMDYDGCMGVPITFLDKYNPEQFEIVGLTGVIDPVDICIENKSGRPYINGERLYARILIRKR